jgi:hypothetical protein
MYCTAVSFASYHGSHRSSFRDCCGDAKGSPIDRTPRVWVVNDSADVDPLSDTLVSSIDIGGQLYGDSHEDVFLYSQSIITQNTD